MRGPVQHAVALWLLLSYIGTFHATNATEDSAALQNATIVDLPEENDDTIVATNEPTRLTPYPTHTVVPSAFPSDAPSHAPSQAPSYSCRDNPFYQSSINNFTCSDHLDTDCLQWRFLGLNISEVERLVENCPIACNIACDTFSSFRVNQTFKIYNLQSYLSPESDETMEEAVVEYLTNYIRNLLPTSRMFLYQAQLLSQHLAETQVSLYKPNQYPTIDSGRRSLEEEEEEEISLVSLIVTIDFGGYMVGMNDELIQPFLANGIDSLGFTRAIQRSGDPALVEAVSTTNVQLLAIKTQTQTNVRSIGPGALAASVVFGILLPLVAAIMYYYRSKHQSHLDDSEIGVCDEEKDVESVMNSPLESNRSTLAQVLSFDTIVRMCSSPRSWSKDSTCTSSPSSSEPPAAVESNTTPLQNTVAANGSVPVEHPLTGLIPPMIVIDRIDTDEECPDAVSSPYQGNNVVPCNRIDASEDFRRRLKSLNSSFVDVFVPDNQRYGPLQLSWQKHAREEGIIAASTIAGSAPAVSDEPSLLSKEQNAAFGKVQAEGKSDSESLKVDHNHSKVSWQDQVAPSSLNHPRKLIGTSDSVVEQRDAPATKPSDLANLHIHRGKSIAPPANAKNNTSKGANDHRLVGNDVVLDVDGGVNDSLNIGNHTIESQQTATSFMASVLHRSPHGRGRLAQKAVDGGRASEHAELQVEPVKPRQHQAGHGRKISSSSNIELDEGEVQLVFEAPCKGKLGLVIQCATKRGPTVNFVKDYSPLLGKILPGDRLVNIGGVKTSHMTISDVTSLLSGQQSLRWATTVRLVVVRSTIQDHSESVNTNTLASRANHSVQHPTPPRLVRQAPAGKIS